MLKWMIRALTLQLTAMLEDEGFHEAPLARAKSFVALVDAMNTAAELAIPLLERWEVIEIAEQLDGMTKAFHELMLAALARELAKVRDTIEDPATKPMDRAIAREQERTYARLLSEGATLF